MADEPYNNKYNINTSRVQWHNYDGGTYFVTICTANKEYFFGEVLELPVKVGGIIPTSVETRFIASHQASNESTQPSSPTSVETRFIASHQQIIEPQMKLSPIGEYATEQFAKTQTYYPYANIPLFVVMPNHIHAIVIIDNSGNVNAMKHRLGRDAIHRVSSGGVSSDNNPMLSNKLGTVIRGIKARITHYAHQNNIPFAWQTRYYDRIIRNQSELNSIALYVEQNVAKWSLDSMNIFNSIPQIGPQFRDAMNRVSTDGTMDCLDAMNRVSTDGTMDCLDAMNRVSTDGKTDCLDAMNRVSTVLNNSKI